MRSKIIDALKCSIRCPGKAMELMMGSQEQETIEAIKKRCPGVEVESLGYYLGILLAIIFLLLGVSAYIIQVLYNWVW
ncbi:MAG: hypothetical protein U9O85_05105 [Euryarchaeota archaeon]|nr:hypothetical protein [Euryarchaeota archaeon]